MRFKKESFWPFPSGDRAPPSLKLTSLSMALAVWLLLRAGLYGQPVLGSNPSSAHDLTQSLTGQASTTLL